MLFFRSSQPASDDFVFRPESVEVGCFAGWNWTGLSASISGINSNLLETRERFLHDGEIDVFVNIHSKSYRESWFAGRLLAKMLYAERYIQERNIAWKDIRIVSRNALGRSVSPRLFVNDIDTGFVFSLSHAADRVMVVTTDSGAGIGCDLVYRKTAMLGVAKTFFHDTETDDGSGGNSFDAVWAVKEAAYKSCNDNEAFRPRLWLTQRTSGNRFVCRHLDRERRLFADVETYVIDDYTLAVARKS